MWRIIAKQSTWLVSSIFYVELSLTGYHTSFHNIVDMLHSRCFPSIVCTINLTLPKKGLCGDYIFKMARPVRLSWCAVPEGPYWILPVTIHRFIILLICSIHDVFRPLFVLQIPINGQFDTCFKISFRTAENKRQLLIPRGFAHGFVTLTDDVEFLYKADNNYNQPMERSILWSDPELAIDWGVETPIVAEKDGKAPLLRDSDVDFEYRG